MARKRIFLKSSSLAIVAALAAPGGGAVAQDRDSAAQNAITVTARKREERAQDIPLAVNAFTEEDIDRFQIEDFEDLEAMITAAEYIGDNGNPFANEIIIRGGGVGRQVNVDGGTGIYANGVNVQGGNFGGRSLWDVDTFDVARYEVLKGPQGALYGRNALGGAINVISRRPDLDAYSVQVDAGVYNNEGWSLAAYADTPIVQDTLGFRIAARYYDQSKGFYYNPVSDAYIDATTEANIRAVTQWRINDDWSAVFQFDYYDTEREGDTTFNGLVTDDPFVRPNDDINRGEKTEYSYFGAIKGDFDWADLDIVVNHRKRDASRIWDLDEGVAADPFDAADQVACYSVMMMGATVYPGDQRCTESQAGEFDRTSIEARLTGSTERLDWIVGADAFESDDYFNQTEAGRSVNSFALDVTNEVWSWSIFAGLEYSVTDRLKLGAEGRFASEDKDLNSHAELTEGAAAGIVVFDTALDKTFDYATWTAYASYDLSDSALAFARVGTGFRTGGLNQDARDLTDPDTLEVIEVPDFFDEERAISYEAGLKTGWLDEALIVNATGYYVKYKDFISNGNNGLSGLDRVSYVFNIGDAALYGAELESTARINNLPGGATFELNSGVAYTQGDIVDAVDPALEDRKISRVPKWSYTASALLDAPLTKDVDFISSLRFSGQQGGFQTFNNNVTLPEPQVLDLQVGLRGERWLLTGNIANLTNEDALVRNFTSQETGLAREPRTWWIKFSKTFGPAG